MKLKTSARAVARSGQIRVPISSLSTVQKLSAAALSKHDPVRPQLCRNPNALIQLLNWVEVNSLAAAIAVDHAVRLQPTPSVGHVQGVHDEFGAMGSAMA
ncbi:hypothetical protein [Streptomyces antimycoticus]